MVDTSNATACLRAECHGRMSFNDKVNNTQAFFLSMYNCIKTIISVSPVLAKKLFDETFLLLYQK